MLLKKSKEDCQVDATLLKASDEDGEADVEDDREIESFQEEFLRYDEEVWNESLLENFFKLEQWWRNENEQTELLYGMSWSHQPMGEGKGLFEITEEEELNGVLDYDKATLDIWHQELKVKELDLDQGSISTLNHKQIEGQEIATTVSLKSLSNPYGAERRNDIIPFAEFQYYYSSNLVEALVQKVTSSIPLNEMQEYIVTHVIKYLLRKCSDDPTTNEIDDKQMLLYIGGKGGTGKSQIIKAISYSLQIMECLQELAILAPTGAAADNICGSTIHSALNMEVEAFSRKVDSVTIKVTKRMQALQRV